MTCKLVPRNILGTLLCWTCPEMKYRSRVEKTSVTSRVEVFEAKHDCHLWRSKNNSKFPTSTFKKTNKKNKKLDNTQHHLSPALPVLFVWVVGQQQLRYFKQAALKERLSEWKYEQAPQGIRRQNATLKLWEKLLGNTLPRFQIN